MQHSSFKLTWDGMRLGNNQTSCLIVFTVYNTEPLFPCILKCIASTAKQPLTWPLGFLVLLINTVQRQSLLWHIFICHHMNGDLLTTELTATYFYSVTVWMGTYCENQQASRVTSEILHLAVLVFHVISPKFEHNEHHVCNCGLIFASDLSAAFSEAKVIIALDTSVSVIVCLVRSEVIAVMSLYIFIQRKLNVWHFANICK